MQNAGLISLRWWSEATFMFWQIRPERSTFSQTFWSRIPGFHAAQA
jgi:hypothetical protein